MHDVRVLQTNGFLRGYKKLNDNQKDAADRAIACIVGDPTIGAAKQGDLSGVFVHKFDCLNQRFLLACEYDARRRTLLLVGAHENFHRKLKR